MLKYPEAMGLMLWVTRVSGYELKVTRGHDTMSSGSPRGTQGSVGVTGRACRAVFVPGQEADSCPETCSRRM